MRKENDDVDMAEERRKRKRIIPALCGHPWFGRMGRHEVNST